MSKKAYVSPAFVQQVLDTIRRFAEKDGGICFYTLWMHTTWPSRRACEITLRHMRDKGLIVAKCPTYGGRAFNYYLAEA